MKKAAHVAALWGGPFLVSLLFVSLAASQQDRQSDGKPRPEDRPTRTPERIEAPGIENAFRLSPRLYSGGQPQGDKAFKALQALGVKTIVTVDGARPDIEAARRYGIRYVHVPIGYDGVPQTQALKIVAAVKSLPGPVFVHCHHGKHRGPAAAALCGIVSEGWSSADAFSWMKRAGTSPDYRGLFASVAAFKIPPADKLERAAADLPEAADIPPIVDAMIQTDETWDRLKAIREAGFQAPANAPDLDPSHEALQLVEQFRELLRRDEARAKGADFVQKLEEAERRAAALRDALKAHAQTPNAETRKSAEAAFAAAAKTCTGCHTRYRDN